jgi:preprotein translocase subunit YajC
MAEKLEGCPEMGTTHVLAAATAAAKTSGSSELLLLVVLFAVMIVFMFRSSNRRKRQAQTIQNQLVDGAAVRTTFGVYGTVASIDTQNGTVMLEIAPGVQIKVMRQAVNQVLPSDVPDTMEPMPDGNVDGDTASVGTDDRSDKIS